MKTDAEVIVIALGGNAISPSDAEGNIAEQFAASRKTAARLADVIQTGRRVLITHGNGPQVGNVLRRVELAAPEVYPLPLHVCVADTQAGMGYMIGECLSNELRRRGIDRTVATIITNVEVSPDDPAFSAPSKPIGRFYEDERAAEMVQRFGWRMVSVPGRGCRRVVPSPAPRGIVEIDLIRKLVDADQLLIVAGGGGIPVTRSPDGQQAGVEAVIDKDRTSALLAAEIGANALVIATDVRHIALGFGTPAERLIERMTIAEARRHLADGQFPPGSMGPKIEAAIDFLKRSRRSAARVVICALDDLCIAVDGGAGTSIAGD